MSDQSTIRTPGSPEFEEWFLGQLSVDKISVAELLQVVVSVAQQNRAAEADGWAEVLEEALTEQGQSDDVVAVLKARAEWHSGNAAFRAYCEKKLLGALPQRPYPAQVCCQCGL